MSNLREQVDRVTSVVVGRRREIEVVLAALASGRNVVLEGPPGTGKSTLLRAVADARDTELVFVEGNAELTPARLVGSHDPALVLERGYTPETFVDGPLVRAMREGGLLYLEELNRIPEETLNVLVTAMAEREIHVPRLGRVAAEPGFVVVAAMNPFDAVGTARVSAAVYDRTNRVAMPYQVEADETDIVARALVAHHLDARPLIAPAVALVRSTRNHDDIRVGASVRGAIDLVLLAGELAELRSRPATDRGVTLDAALAALTGRIRLHEGTERSPEQVVETLWSRFFATLETAPPDDDPADEAESDDGDRASRGKALSAPDATPAAPGS
ncbi:MAG: MoxR family ATPase [Acidimicrobiales bacterium]|nr:MoxR family ATPase [Acidimicrobiales bacterium]